MANNELNKINSSFLHMARLTGALATGAEEWRSEPFRLEFAPNNTCNLRCAMCTHSAGLASSKMREEDTRHVLDQLLPMAGILTPSALSEPLLSGIELIMQKCMQHDTWLEIITNGTLLTEEMFEFLAPRLYQLKFSFETHVPDTFERLRIGADYSATLKNLEYSARRSAQLDIPFSVVTIMMQPLVDEIVEFVNFLADRDIRRLDVLHLLDNVPDSDVLRVPEERISALRQELIDRTGHRGMDLRLLMPAPFGGFFIRSPNPVRGLLPEVIDTYHNTLKKEYPAFCHHMAAYLKVDPFGNAYPCCIGPESLCLGNILKQSFAEIWNGAKARELRRSFFSGHLLPACRSCPSRPELTCH